MAGALQDTADKTSAYKFYQFWLNTSDEDSEKYIKIFTFLDETTILDLIKTHQDAPHLRVLQKRLAEEVTKFVHNETVLEKAQKASAILFGNGTAADLKTLDSATFLEIFEGVPKAQIARNELENGLEIVTMLNEKTGFCKSNGEARRALSENSISVNKEKITENYRVSTTDLINNEFILLQRGKKNYCVVQIVSL